MPGDDILGTTRCSRLCYVTFVMDKTLSAELFSFLQPFPLSTDFFFRVGVGGWGVGAVVWGEGGGGGGYYPFPFQTSFVLFYYFPLNRVVVVVVVNPFNRVCCWYYPFPFQTSFRFL